ncbi:hypothetical protein [Desulfuribacillus alkaliarsenatis]|uniref:Uncharacterized protein n=1 Tax=Desulfuribacillus alkaliarsenatis TaxID=766136 RepID=A0A1E5G2A9_9FIRM|nr:hypothetical protein [Desulfuribacillus alkaliarsenatis]OEF97109.1 hypothetical protein BHF68_05800 [Desulfuribacillus alkaliarsenatis]
MRERGDFQKTLGKMPQNNSRYELDNASYKDADELGILTMQRVIGNRVTELLLAEQEEDNQVSELATPIKDKQGNLDENSSHTLSVTTGQIQVSIDKDEELLELTTMERREDNKSEPLHGYQKQVNKNKPEKKSLGTMSVHSQNWQKGAVTIVNPINKAGKKTTNMVKSFIKDDESGNLPKVLPFLNQQKTEQEKKSWEAVKKQTNYLRQAGPSESVDLIHNKADKQVHNKGQIIEQKKNKESEFSKKIDQGLQNIQNKEVALTREDFFDVIMSVRRKRRQDEKGVGSEEIITVTEPVKEDEEKELE